MADNLILVDTSILIGYYRKTDKENAVWINLIRRGFSFAISTETKFEICTGSSELQINFWNEIFSQLTIIPLDEASVDTAVKINAALKKKRKQVDIADLFIAATAVAHNLTLSTLNKKHFERIDELALVE